MSTPIHTKPGKILNLAILAHIDAGKTTLSERILFSTGEIHQAGDVEDGLATMDYLPEEKDKGITIEAGVAHFRWKNIWFNFIDTPGHVDFSAEVDMALDAVDGAVLVVSATGGVETQTTSAWTKLRERNIPVLIYINKLDHPHGDLDNALLSIEERLGVRPLLMSTPVSADNNLYAMMDVLTQKQISQDASGRENLVDSLSNTAFQLSESLRNELTDAATLVDDSILKDHLDGLRIDEGRLVQAFKSSIAGGSYVLCYSGSALCNQGVRQLLTGVSLFFDTKITNDKLLGRVIRIRSCRQVGEFALFKSHVQLVESKWPKGFAFHRITAEMLEPVHEIHVGDIYALVCPSQELELGDLINLKGQVTQHQYSAQHYQPLLQTSIECLVHEDWTNVNRALHVISRMDPSCQVKDHPDSGTWSLLTVGEVQQEVLLSRLQREFGCQVRASEPRVRYMERLAVSAIVCENQLTVGPHFVKVTFEISNDELLNELGTYAFVNESSIALSAEIEQAIRSAIEDLIPEGIAGKGELSGLHVKLMNWACSDEIPQGLAKRAAGDALRLHLKKDQIEIFEPIMVMELHAPTEYAGNLLGDLQSRDAKIENLGGDAEIVKIFAQVPLKNVFGYSTIGRSISKGTASYALRFYGYRKIQKGSSGPTEALNT